MSVGLKRGRYPSCKYFFVKCKINTKINTHITQQIESLNSLACLNIKIIYLYLHSDWLNALTAFMRKVSSSLRTTKQICPGQCMQKCVKIKNIVHSLVISSLCVAPVGA